MEFLERAARLRRARWRIPSWRIGIVLVVIMSGSMWFASESRAAAGKRDKTQYNWDVQHRPIPRSSLECDTRETLQFVPSLLHNRSPQTDCDVRVLQSAIAINARTLHVSFSCSHRGRRDLTCGGVKPFSAVQQRVRGHC